MHRPRGHTAFLARLDLERLIAFIPDPAPRARRRRRRTSPHLPWHSSAMSLASQCLVSWLGWASLAFKNGISPRVSSIIQRFCSRQTDGNHSPPLEPQTLEAMLSLWLSLDMADTGRISGTYELVNFWRRNGQKLRRGEELRHLPSPDCGENKLQLL